MSCVVTGIEGDRLCVLRCQGMADYNLMAYVSQDRKSVNVLRCHGMAENQLMSCIVTGW